jgi:hypothetical protein
VLNQPVAGSDSLYTTVRNLTEADKFFGFLPPHGRTLGSGEEFSFFGSIEGYMNRRVVRDRSRRSLEQALADGILAIVKTPAAFVYDATLDQTKVVGLENAEWVRQDPTWGAYSSSDSGPLH